MFGILRKQVGLRKKIIVKALFPAVKDVPICSHRAKVKSPFVVTVRFLRKGGFPITTRTEFDRSPPLMPTAR